MLRLLGEEALSSMSSVLGKGGCVVFIFHLWGSTSQDIGIMAGCVLGRWISWRWGQ